MKNEFYLVEIKNKEHKKTLFAENSLQTEDDHHITRTLDNAFILNVKNRKKVIKENQMITAEQTSYLILNTQYEACLITPYNQDTQFDDLCFHFSEFYKKSFVALKEIDKKHILIFIKNITIKLTLLFIIFTVFKYTFFYFDNFTIISQESIKQDKSSIIKKYILNFFTTQDKSAPLLEEKKEEIPLMQDKKEHLHKKQQNKKGKIAAPKEQIADEIDQPSPFIDSDAKYFLNLYGKE